MSCARRAVFYFLLENMTGFVLISFLFVITELWPVGQAVKTPPSHGGNSGSIPLRAVAAKKKALISGLFFVERVYNGRFFYYNKRVGCRWTVSGLSTFVCRIKVTTSGSCMSSFRDASARSSRSGANLAKNARKHRRSSNARQEAHASPSVCLWREKRYEHFGS